jgi:integrase
MVVFVAHTGARGSEILRARIDDFNFESETVLIREKKKSKAKATTYRRVAMTKLLKNVMQECFAEHPGGQLAIVREGDAGPYSPSVHEAHKHFKHVLANSAWSRIWPETSSLTESVSITSLHSSRTIALQSDRAPSSLHLAPALSW